MILRGGVRDMTGLASFPRIAMGSEGFVSFAQGGGGVDGAYGAPTRITTLSLH